MPSGYTSVVAATVGVYRQTLRTVFPTACKHHPSCSEYCIQAFDRHGVMVGAKLTFLRVLRCHPFSRGGYDPVPPSRT